MEKGLTSKNHSFGAKTSAFVHYQPSRYAVPHIVGRRSNHNLIISIISRTPNLANEMKEERV